MPLFLANWHRTYAGATKAVGNADGDADVDAADLAIWRSDFGGKGSSGPGKLLTGFVRYVTAAPATAPEPTSTWLIGIRLATLAAHSLRKSPSTGNS